MKTFRFNAFETNSSSSHAIAIVSGKKWDEFEQGNGLYSFDWEYLLTSDELYERFLEGDQDGDYYSETYRDYLEKKHAEKLTLWEFSYVVQNKDIADNCHSERSYQLPNWIKEEIVSTFGSESHLNREVFEIIGDWFSDFGMMTYKQFDADDSMYACSDTIEGVRVVAYGYYTDC